MKRINVVSFASGRLEKKVFEQQKSDRFWSYLLEVLNSEKAITAPFGDLSHLFCKVDIENGALRVWLVKSDQTPVFEFIISRKSQYGIKLWERICSENNFDVERPVAPWCGFFEHEKQNMSYSEKNLISEFVYGLSCSWIQYRRPNRQKGEAV